MKIKFLFFSLIFISILSFSVYADEEPDTIKVGLTRYFKNIDNFNVSNTEIQVGYEGENPIGTLYSKEGFTFAPVTSNFYKLDKTFTDYTSATQTADYYRSAGFESCVAFLNNSTYYVFVNANEADNLPDDDLTSDGSIITGDVNRLGVYGNNELLLVFLNEDPYIEGVDDAPLVLDSGYRTYRGQISPVFNNNKMTLVNTLNMDEYLYGVVPNEMPYEWNEEALKAQAVAARTFAYKNMNKHIGEGYNVCDNEHCQVYLGYTSEKESTNKAVDDTHGLEIYYNNSLIDAVFFSSSGGVTANSEDVWTNSLPYLREKLDIYDTTGKVWERQYSLQDLTNIAKEYTDDNNLPYIGNVISLRIDETSNYGRVNKLTIVGDKGELPLTKENIRYFFAYGDDPSLESRYFTISSGGEDILIPGQNNTTYEVYIYGNGTPINNMSPYYVIGANENPVSLDYSFTATNGNVYAYGVESSINQNIETTGDTITISGKGWGHGVGLSQHGANGMASAGFNFEEILQFYYTGVEIK